jgi:hypothetical protein
MEMRGDGDERGWRRESEQVKKQKGKSSVLKQTSTSSVRLPADSVLAEVLNPLACVFVLSTVDKRRQAGSEKWLVNMSSIFCINNDCPCRCGDEFSDQVSVRIFQRRTWSILDWAADLRSIRRRLN